MPNNKYKDFYFGPDETVLYETKDGYVITVEPNKWDGGSTYVIYDSTGNYVDEFNGEDLTDDQKAADKFEETEIYKHCIDIILDWEEKWGDGAASWEDSYLTDPRFMFWNNDDYKKIDYKPKSPEEIAKEKEAEKQRLEELCKSDTIVFHMDDHSTVMLKPIYEGRGWDVYTGSGWGVSREFIHELIKRHDKILCLGHGTPRGLIGGTIGVEEAPLLKEKKVFALWCYAATYFKDNGFKGHGVFCSDNCPSEVWECRAACNADVSAEWILDNMYYLSDCIKNVIDMTWDNPEEACRIAKENYSKAKAETEDEKKVVEFNTNTLQVV